MGIEPTSEAWEASILPLYDARVLLQIWSGVRESNPRPDLGKVPCYHYTNAALSTTVLQSWCATQGLNLRPLACEASALPLS